MLYILHERFSILVQTEKIKSRTETRLANVLDDIPEVLLEKAETSNRSATDGELVIPVLPPLTIAQQNLPQATDADKLYLLIEIF